MNANHGEQSLVFDDEVIASPPAAAAMARIAPLFDFHQRRLQHEPRVWQHSREINQLVKQSEEAALLRSHAARDFFSPTLREAHELLANDERFHHQSIVAF